jgi:mono/diheme cytochrome c family protein
MNDESRPDEANRPEPPAFDKEAARRRYRATMRSPRMRLLYAALALVILASWAFGLAAVFAKDVERLPGHALGVLPRQCLACHTQRLNAAPPMPHTAFPTCGFCHRQSAPTPSR